MQYPYPRTVQLRANALIPVLLVGHEVVFFFLFLHRFSRCTNFQTEKQSNNPQPSIPRFPAVLERVSPPLSRLFNTPPRLTFFCGSVQPRHSIFWFGFGSPSRTSSRSI